MTRIIAGSARGRRLIVPKNGTRPTADRVRESLFSSLGSQLGSWQGLAILDLFAGSGAFGLEAISRGAASVVLVESDREAAETCRRNAKTVGADSAEVVQADVSMWLVADATGAFDVVFADPPYVLSDDQADAIAGALVAYSWLAPEAIVAFERPRSAGQISWPDGFADITNKIFGDTEIQRAVWYGQNASKAIRG